MGIGCFMTDRFSEQASCNRLLSVSITDKDLVTRSMWDLLISNSIIIIAFKGTI